MVLIVPVEELPAEASGILDTAEAFGKARLILQGLEVAFGERVVVGPCFVGASQLAETRTGRVRPVMRPGDAEACPRA
jgi:hypothetical protein